MQAWASGPPQKSRWFHAADMFPGESISLVIAFGMLIVNYAGLAYINTVNASSDCFGEANHLSPIFCTVSTNFRPGSGKGAKLCKRGLLARLKSPPYWISGYNIQQNGILSFSA
jgi:hypothetical protein